MTTAFVYLMVSGLAQVDGQGFDRQLSACEKYARDNGIEIAHVYREEGVTGKSELDNRPALQQLIADLLSNGTRLVLIERLDRLARDLIIQESILRDMERKGVQFISVAEPDLCSADPTRTLIRQILGAFFEYERKAIVSKLADARNRIKAKTGRCEGVKPFGRDPARPEEAATLRAMLTLDEMGRKADSIAEELYEFGHRSRAGKPIRSSTIRKILKRERSSNPVPEKAS